MPFVRTERGEFYYEESGRPGKAVYLLHGLTVNGRDWDAIPDVLGKTRFHAFTFDMRGHGTTYLNQIAQGRESYSASDDYSPEGHARDVEACARAMGHSKLHLVGHSTGARNALVFAALFPERALSLTLVDQTLAKDPEGWKKYAERFRETPTPFKNEEALDKYLRKKCRRNPELFSSYKTQYFKNGQEQWDWYFSKNAVMETQRLGRKKDAFEWLEKVKCPVLFIRGALSEYVPPAEVEKIKGLLPKGRIETVEKAGHAVFRDNPEDFLRVLVPFLFGK
jgi:pimeloyl-ACP methyl ester carboxylesterase